MLHCFPLWKHLIELVSIVLLGDLNLGLLKGNQVEQLLAIVFSNDFSYDFMMGRSLRSRDALGVYLSLHGFVVQTTL